MKKIVKIIRTLLITVIVFSFSLAPLDFFNFNWNFFKARSAKHIQITKDTFWEKEDDIIIKDWITITNGATLTIEKGTTITFDNSDGYIPTLSVINGKIIADGTQKEKIIFKIAEQEYEEDELGYSIRLINLKESETSIFRHVEFQKGGYYPKLVRNDNFVFPKNILLASKGFPALSIYNGKTRIENSSFKDSVSFSLAARIEEDLEDPQNNFLEIGNSNFESSKEEIAIQSETFCHSYHEEKECPEKIILKNNWYASPLGPKTEPEYLIGGEKIIGNYTLKNFRTKSYIFDPVIIIPGILGSWETNDGWEVDPILHIFHNLIHSLKENGFEENINLFEFPYEWRNSNVLTAEFLKEKIEEIKNLAGVSKVDLVAHSMGGLVSRQYIQGKNYSDDIDQLITLGTPHHGAPKSYTSWEAGEINTDLDKKIDSYIIKKIFQIEAFHTGYSDLKKYIQENILSVKELLPDYNYLFDKEKNKMKDYPQNYPQNNFLENLNKKNNLNNLENIDFTNIIGKTQEKNTIKKFRTVTSIRDGKWKHGMPENFYNLSTDQGIEYGKGDETVPLASAKNIKADETIELESTHGDLPTKAQCKIFEKLSGKTQCEYFTTFERITDILTFGIFSPVDIQIISPSGKKVGTNFETGEIVNEIEGAFYSGNNTENEFLTIPNPEDGEYQIIIQGTGEGEYTVQISQIKEFNDGVKSRTISSQIGIATLGTQENFDFLFEDSDFEDETADYQQTLSTNSNQNSSANNSEEDEENNNDKKNSKKKDIKKSEENFFQTNSQNTLLSGFTKNNSVSNKANTKSDDLKKQKAYNSQIKESKRKTFLLWLFFVFIFILGIIAFFNKKFFIYHKNKK